MVSLVGLIYFLIRDKQLTKYRRSVFLETGESHHRCFAYRPEEARNPRYERDTNSACAAFDTQGADGKVW